MNCAKPHDEGEARNVWVEKTILTFAPDYRTSGPLAHGRSLLSPVASTNGADVYKPMRQVKPGDLVLHLFNSEEIAGYSVVSGRYREILQDGKKMYAVPLIGFQTLIPPLQRRIIFSEPFSARILALFEGGLKHTFFTRQLKLAQGAYLTPVSPELMQVLNDAYQSLTGETISSRIQQAQFREGA